MALEMRNTQAERMYLDLSLQERSVAFEMLKRIVIRRNAK